MRNTVVLLAAIAFGATLAMPPAAVAADLKATDAKPRAVRIVHKHARIVRDYDGTAVLVRRGPLVVRDESGVPVMHPDAVWLTPLVRPEPDRYINGQPVRPIARIR